MERQISRANARPHHGGREVCWSEGATGTLIEAWGDRYARLNGGNLQQKDWKEVADAVNGRQKDVRPQKTDVQCKNRVDTLKKKYKLEKSKPLPSKWNFFNGLDSLIGSNGVTSKKSRSATSATNSSKPKLISNLNQEMYSAWSSRLNFSGGGSTESSLGLENDNDEENEDLGFDQKPGKKEQMGTADSSDGAAYRHLARAILKFGEIYERIESSKQQQMVELEKQRMEFTKDLEFQRMNMFMDAQMELEKINRPKKHASGSGKKSRDEVNSKRSFLSKQRLDKTFKWEEILCPIGLVHLMNPDKHWLPVRCKEKGHWKTPSYSSLHHHQRT